MHAALVPWRANWNVPKVFALIAKPSFFVLQANPHNGISCSSVGEPYSTLAQAVNI
jgi:hypothetical protein